jgi:hypothetical protein
MVTLFEVQLGKLGHAWQWLTRQKQPWRFVIALVCLVLLVLVATHYLSELIIFEESNSAVKAILIGILLALAVLLAWLVPAKLSPVKWDQVLFLTREELALNVIRQVESDALTIVSGESGAGKSTLLNDFVIPKLKDANWSVISVPGFPSAKALASGLYDALHDAGIKIQMQTFLRTGSIGAIPIGRPMLLVLDHFEQVFSCFDDERRAVGGAPGLLQWFDKFLTSWISPEAKRHCIIILRKEYFLNLRCFQEVCVDVFTKTVVIPTIDFRDTSSEDTSQATAELQDIVHNNETVESILDDLKGSGQVLALEIQVLCRMLRDIEEHTKVSSISFRNYKDLGRRSGLVRSYFMRIVQSTRNPTDTSAVLFALSCGRRRIRLSVDEIQLVTHRQRDSVEAAVQALTNAGIVLEDSGLCSIRHDYLANAFDELSSGLLEAGDRDSIRYFVDLTLDKEVNKGRLDQVTINETPRRVDLIDLIALSSLIIAVIRLFGGWHGADVLRGWVPASGSNGSHIDLRYLPSFIGSVSCALYVWQLFRNFVLKIPERRVFTWVTVAFIWVMILCGTLVVHLWLVFACLGGLLIGIRLGSAYWPLGGRRFVVHHVNLLQQTTSRFFVYLLMILIIGIVIAAERYWRPLGTDILMAVDERYGFAAELVLALGMFAYMMYSLRTHGTKEKAAVMLGILDRMKAA